MTDNTIYFDCPIYLDTLTLLLKSEKTDILNEVQCQIEQGDPCFDNVKNEIIDKIQNNKNVSDIIKRSFGLDIDCEELEEIFDNDDTSTLMKYVTYDENYITIDYSETAICNNSRLCVYNIPCKFNFIKYIKDRYPAN